LQVDLIQALLLILLASARPTSYFFYQPHDGNFFPSLNRADAQSCLSDTDGAETSGYRVEFAAAPINCGAARKKGSRAAGFSILDGKAVSLHVVPTSFA
jgi:hypothetical protein